MNEGVVRNAKAFQDEEQKLQGAQKWDDLAKLYEARANAGVDEAQRERMLFRAGEVTLEHLKQPDQAEGYFTRAFEVRRSFLPALGALKALHTERKNVAGVRKVLSYEIDVTKDPRRLGQLHHEAGKLLRDEGKAEEAIAQLLKAIEVNPKARQPLADLEPLAKKVGRFGALVQAYQLLAGATQEKESAIFQFLAGGVLKENVKNLDEASKAFAASLEAGPKDPRALSDMTRFFEQRAEWPLAARALFQHLEAIAPEDVKERVRILKRLATLHETGLSAPQQAVKLLQRVVELKADEPQVIKQLQTLGEKLKDPKVVAQGLELEAELPGLEAKERAALYEKAADQRDKAREGRAALKDVKRSLELRPNNVTALRLMDAITRKLGDWPEHVRTLEQQRDLLDTKKPEQKKAAIVLWKRLADVHEQKLKDDAKASEALGKAVTLDPADMQALERLEVIARRAGNWAEVGRVLERRVAAAPDEPNAKVWLRELSQLRRDHLNDTKGAAQALEQLLALKPADPLPALRDLATLQQVNQTWPQLAETWAKLGEQERDPAAQAAALRQLAQVRVSRLDEPEDAAKALDAAMALVSDGDAALEASRIMVDVARALKDDAKLAKALATWTRLEPDPVAQRRIRFELAGIEERRGNASGALAAYEEVLSESPADEGALTAAVRLLLAADRPGDAAQRLEAALTSAALARPRAGALAHELAAIAEKRLMDPKRARVAWRHALEAQPDDRDAFERFVALSLEGGAPAHKDLLSTLEVVAPRATSAELRLAMWREQASVAETLLNQPPAAVAALERLRAQSPQDAGASKALRRLYRKVQRWGELAQLLEATALLPIPPAPELDAAGAWRELAEVAEEQLDDLPRAAHALEELLAQSTDAADTAWDQLVSLDRQLRRFEELVQVLQKAASLGGDPATRVRRLMLAAEVQEREMSAPADAAATLEEALTVTPKSRELLTRLARVLVRAGAHQKACAALADAAAVAGAAGDPSGAAALLVERGQVLQQTGDLAQAEDAFQAAITADRGHAPAHEALIALHTKLGRWDRLEQALNQAAVAVQGKAKAPLLVQRGEMLAVRLNRVDEAIAAFDEAEAVHPRDPACRDARVRALRDANRPAMLADALAARRDADPLELDRPAKNALLREEAELRGFQLGELPAARALLLEALGPGAPATWSADDRETLRCLLRVERRMALGAPLAEHLEAAAGVEQDAGTKADLLIEAGRVRRQRQDDVVRARQLMERALEVDAQRVEAVRWLAAIARDKNDAKELARWTAREAELETDKKRKAELLVRVAAGQKKEPGHGRATLEEALKHDPENIEAHRALSPILRGLKAWPELAVTLERLAALEPDERGKVDRLVSLGELRLGALKQPEEARAGFQAALAIAPDELRALKGLAQTLDPKKSPKVLVETLERLLKQSSQAEQRLALGKQIATLRQERLADPDGAVAALGEVLKLAPDDEAAWRQLRDIHLEKQDFKALAADYEAQARRTVEPAQREERLRQAVMIVQHHLKDKERTVALFQEILALGDPQCLAINELPKLLLELGRDDAYEAALARVREIVPKTKVAAANLVLLAERRKKRGQAEVAAQHYEAALEEDPTTVAALDGLAGLHEAAKDWSRLVAVLERKRKLFPDDDARSVELRLSRASLLEERLKDLPGAAEELRAAAVAASGRPDILERLAAICRKCEWWKELPPVLGALSQRTKDPAKAAKLLEERAAVEKEKLRAPRAAIESYRAALQRKPTSGIVDRLIELYEHEELWDELVKALEERARLEDDQRERARLLKRAALVLDQKLHRPEDSIQAWNRALDNSPDQDAFDALQSLCERSKDDRRLADAFGREVDTLNQRIADLQDPPAESNQSPSIGAATSPARSTGSGRRAIRTEARDGVDATERLVQQALKGAAIYGKLNLANRAQALLEAAFKRDPGARGAFEALEKLFIGRKEPARLYELLARFAAHAPSADERAALHERLAKLAEDELKNAQDARTHWEQVLALQPGSVAASTALRRLYASAHAWEDLARVLQVSAHATGALLATGDQTQVQRLVELSLDLGDVLERQLERREEAARAFAEAAARAPSDPRPLLGLDRVHEATQAWTELVRVRLRLRDQEVDPRRRAQWALKVADAYERLQQRDEAIRALREALEEVPDNASVLALLRRYLIEAERWTDAIDILAREADVARERATQLARRMDRAAILRDQLGRDAAAIQELERARALAPQDKAPLGQLAKLYEKTAESLKLADVLQSLAIVEDDDRAAADLLERAGGLLEKTEPESAATAHERAARRDSLRAAPLDALARIYEAREAWPDLVRTLHRRATLAKALGEEAAPFLRRAAVVEEQRLGQQQLAAASLEVLLEQAPRDRETLAELARLRGTLGEHAAHQEVLGRLAEVTPDDRQRAKLLLERAGILETKLRRPAAAAECVKAALELKPADPRELSGVLIRLAKAAGDDRALLEATDRALEHARDKGDEALLLRSVAELAAGPVYTPDRAIEVWSELYRRDPGDAAVRAGVEGVLVREARHSDLLNFFLAESKRLQKAGAAADVQRLRHRMAELHRGVLGDAAAAEACYREALEADADDSVARSGLEALFRASKRFPELAKLLAERAERARTELEAVQALVEEAAVHEEQGAAGLAVQRLEAARDRSRRARDIGADLQVRILRALIRLYRNEKKHDALAQALATLADRDDLPAGDRATAHTELGQVLLRDLKREDDAVKAFERALALDIQSVPAARALQAIHRAANRQADLARVYEREAAAKVDRGRLVYLKTQIGTIRHQLADLEGAARAFGEALQLDGVSLTALRGMADVARALNDYHALAQALEALAEHSPSPVDRLEARRELAHLYEEALSDLRRAVACYRKVLADAPDDLEAVRGLARGLRAVGDEAGLAETLEAELGLVSETERRRLLALEASRLREALAEKATSADQKQALLGRALGLARTACELLSSDSEALGSYARIAEKLNHWGELADVTCLLARSVDDPVRAGWMLRRAAKLRALRLSDPKGAIAAYREAVATNPGDTEAWEALEPLAAEVEDDALLLQVLERSVALTKKDASRGQAAIKLGRHLMKLGKVSEAIDAYVTARELSRGPLLAQALESLEAAYRLAGRHAELAQVLEQRAADGRAPNARDLLLERAGLLEERLGRHDQAIEVLSRLHQLVPDDQRVATELERLLSGQGRWTDLVTFYEGQAARRGPRSYDALVLLGRVLRDRLDDPERAAKALQRAVTMNTSGIEAVEALRDLYAKTERWSELLDTLRLEIGLVKQPRQRESRLRRAGHLAEEKLGDLLTASRFYLEASTLSPKDRNLLGDLARVQEARGDFAGLIETLRRDQPLISEPGELVRLHKRLGLTFAQKLYRKQDALACYRAALTLAPQDEESLAALTDLLRDLGEWDELALIIERRLKQARGKDAVTLKLELARVRAERLGKPEEALKAAEDALTDDPRCIEAVLLQLTVYRRTNQDGKQDANFGRALRRLAGLREGTEKADALVELADVLKRGKTKGKEEHALGALLEAAKADPAHEGALTRLGAQQEAAGLWDDLLRTYELGAAHARTDFKKGDLLTRIATILEQQKRDLPAAEARYREAIALAPTHLPALKGLARVLHGRGAGAVGAAESVAEALARLEDQIAELEQDPRDKALALVRAGDVRREALGQFPAARQRYEHALQKYPTLFPALAALAELAWAADDAPVALSCLERVASAPELPKDAERGAELLWARGQLLEAKGKPEAAGQSYKQALELQPGHLPALEDLGRLCVAGGGWPAARSIFEELATRTKPPQVRAEHQLTLAKVLAKLKETDRAVELYREGLKVLPRHAHGHYELAKLVESKDTREAKRHLDWALACAGKDLEVQVRVALADVCELGLQDADAAAGHLAAIMPIEGEHRGKTARRLAEIHGRAERWSDAVKHLSRAIELEPNRRKQSELYANLARVVRDRLKQRKLARRCFQQAFTLNPRERHTLDSLLRLLEAEGDLDAVVRVLGVAAEANKATGDEPALRLKRADVLAQQKKAREAAEEYERVLALEPRHSGARAQLSRLYIELRDVAGTERVHRTLLAEDPLMVEAYRALADGWRAGGRADELGQALQVLSVLRASTHEEEEAVRAAAAQPPKFRGKLREEDVVQTVLHESCRGPLGELMRAAGGLLLKQVPDDLKNHGIGFFSGRLSLDGDSFPEHRLVKRVCEALDVGAIDLYWMPEARRPEPIMGHSKTPSLILCPEVFAGLSEPEKAFVIARAVAPLRLGLEVFRALPTDQVRLLVLAVLKAFDATRVFKGEDDRTLRGFVKTVSKTPELLRALEPVHEQLWRSREQLDLEGFRQGVMLTASRAALLAAGGSLASVKAIVATNVSLRGRIAEKTEGVVRDFREVPELRDLLAWSVSAGYLDLRKRLARV